MFGNGKAENGGPVAGYVSALDVGGNGRVPAGEVPAQRKALSLNTAPVPDTLADAIKVATIDAKGGAATIDQIHEVVNAGTKDGAHYPRGVIDAKVGEMEKAGVLARQGDAYALADGARAEIEDPAAVVKRRAEILGTMFMNLQPEGESFDRLEGVTASELSVYMKAETLTANGFETRDYAADVLAGDLNALADAGVLVKRSAYEEARVRVGDAPSEEGVEADEDVEELPDAGALDEEADESEDDDGLAAETEEDAEPAAGTLPPAYTFAPAAMPRMANMGAVALAATSVPAAAADVAAAAGAVTTERTLFERKLAAQVEELKQTIAHKDAFMARIDAALTSKRLGFIFDEAKGAAPPPPPPSVVYFAHTQTVAMTAEEKAVILGEVDAIERQIAEEEARVEGAKMTAASVRTMCKERIENLTGQKKELLEMSRGPERTYTVEAYAELDTSGADVVRILRAKSDHRVLLREVLKPAAALEAMALSEVKPAAEVTPAPAPAAPPALPATDDAETAAAIAAEKKAEQAAAVPPSPVGKVTISVAGLLPYVFEAVIVAGADGIVRERLTGAVIGLTGVKASGGVEVFVAKAAEKLVTADEIDLRDGVLVFPVKKTILGMTAGAGDTGLRENDVLHLFAEGTHVRETDGVKAALLAGVEDAIAGGDLCRGSLPGDMGDILWLSGETDPRRLGDGKGSAPAESQGQPAAPKGRGRGKIAEAGPATAKKKPGPKSAKK